MELKRAVIDKSTAADHVIVAAVPGKRIIVASRKLVCAGDVVVTWKSDSTVIDGPCAFAANGGEMMPPWPTPNDASDPASQAGYLVTAVGEALVMSLDSAVQVGGSLTYWETR